MIILIHGEDTYRSRQYLKTIMKQFRIKHDPGNLNLSKIDGVKISFEELSKEFSSIPFLAKKRMVVIEGFLSKNKNVAATFRSPRGNLKSLPRRMTGVSATSASPDSRDFIEHILKIDDSIIVFFEGADLRKNEFVKILSRKRKGEIRIYNYPLLLGYNLKQWILGEAKNLGINIQPAAIEILIQNIGNDLWKMSNELRKLAAYCKDKKLITRDDANLLVPSKLEDNIFKLTDALGDKDIKTCLRIFREMLELEPDKVEYILTMLVRQFRILLETKSFLDDKKNATRDDIANKFKLHPFVASKALMQSKKFELDELKKIYAKILEFENKQKTGYIKPALMFDLLAVKL